MEHMHLTSDHATRFATATLSHLGREYPYKMDLVLTGPEDAKPPREHHPIFHGSFDWHSCVHGWWQILRLARRFPDLAVSADTRARADAMLKFALENPFAVTAENSLFSLFLLKQARRASRAPVAAAPPAKDVGGSEPSAHLSAATGDSDGRSPNRVFVVHGRDEKARTAVVSFLESVGLEGIVLHDQPNMGRHLLTKFIDEAALVTFAVVLMTDDDVGSAKGGQLLPRARQNVILELGYFIAHLGQPRVCALISPGLETPSDFDGIVYIKMSADKRWQTELLRELVAAKMPVAS